MKHSGESALVTKPAGKRDFREAGRFPASQHRLGLFDSPLNKVLIRRMPRRLFKEPGEMISAQVPRYFSQLSERDFVIYVLLDIFQNSQKPPTWQPPFYL